MRKCLGKHSCMSSSFPVVILNDTSFFPTVQLQVHKRNSVRDGDASSSTSNPKPTKLNNPTDCKNQEYHARADQYERPTPSTQND